MHDAFAAFRAAPQAVFGLLCRPVILVGMIVTISGCGGSDRPKTIAVSGVVTVNGASPEQPGALFFAPLEVVEGYPRRGGRALFETDGNFEATSFEPGDGLVPGTYRVRIESWIVPPSMGKPGKSYIPKGFEAPELVVPADAKSVEYDLDVK